MIRIIFIFSGIFFFITVQAQSKITGNQESDILQRLKTSDLYSSGVVVSMDEGIEDNYYKHLTYNNKREEAMGYRIRIFTSTGVDAAEKARMERSRFLSKYDEIGAYIEYVLPDYEVYVGDCRTWSDVLKLYYRIKDDFPNSFPISQPINVEK